VPRKKKELPAAESSAALTRKQQKEAQLAQLREAMAADIDEFRTYSVDELAVALGTKPWRIYTMIEQGTAPPHHKRGSRFYFPKHAVKEWQIAGGRV
jgi:excisionase family DNA binding protein